ncbi:uncharacterized protein LOC124165929 [Ischnura elegans]|uniref:uncharacterized protein LOC124165929 n=1 Tax=Ischnura elegans TaxID=197161 RepID=UPI001ED89B16|nr:uncharacterized protein LOC124165929 [Ischnura elegans]
MGAICGCFKKNKEEKTDLLDLYINRNTLRKSIDSEIAILLDLEFEPLDLHIDPYTHPPVADLLDLVLEQNFLLEDFDPDISETTPSSPSSETQPPSVPPQRNQFDIQLEENSEYQATIPDDKKLSVSTLPPYPKIETMLFELREKKNIQILVIF